MMETKWTPGPWKTVKAYGHEPEHIYWDVTPKDSGWEFVATVWCSKDSDSRITREAMDANAHLIAAAPELAEALQRCVEYMTADAMNLATAHGVADWKSTAPHAAQIIDAARAALAKARGE